MASSRTNSGIIRGSERAVEATAAFVSLQCTTSLCVTLRSRRLVCQVSEYADAQGGPQPGTRSAVIVVLIAHHRRTMSYPVELLHAAVPLPWCQNKRCASSRPTRMCPNTRWPCCDCHCRPTFALRTPDCNSAGRVAICLRNQRSADTRTVRDASITTGA
jgi:hypothetical protein